MNDAFIDLIRQGPVLRLLLCMGGSVVLFFVWTAITARNTLRRRQARAAGQPPPPGVLTKIGRYLVSLFKNLFSDADHDSSDDDPADQPETLPLPDLDFPEQAEPPLESEPEPPPVQQPLDEIAAAPPEEEEMTLPVGPQPQRSERLEYVPGSGELPQDAVEVMRVWRDINDGALLVQIGDTLFRSVAEMRDRGLARRFISVVKDLAQLATVGARAAGLPIPNFEATSGVVSEPGAWSTNPPTLKTPPTTPSQPTSPKPVLKMTPNDPTENMIDPDDLGIAGQINQLLQLRLRQTPVFRERHIRMRSRSDGSLEIVVDDNVYNSVGAIEDREVREFVAVVVKEWEASQ